MDSVLQGISPTLKSCPQPFLPPPPQNSISVICLTPLYQKPPQNFGELNSHPLSHFLKKQKIHSLLKTQKVQVSPWLPTLKIFQTPPPRPPYRKGEGGGGGGRALCINGIISALHTNKACGGKWRIKYQAYRILKFVYSYRACRHNQKKYLNKACCFNKSYIFNKHKRDSLKYRRLLCMNTNDSMRINLKD